MISAGLLDARFDVAVAESGMMLCGERAVMAGARTLLGHPTACVCRDWELNALTAILDQCIDEPAARTVIVTVAAGMGKTRLTAEFITRVQRRDATIRPFEHESCFTEACPFRGSRTLRPTTQGVLGWYSSDGDTLVC
jgi:eukaryotic-like serine/threonine-protein kinase